jgi:hypothetical protein
MLKKIGPIEVLASPFIEFLEGLVSKNNLYNKLQFKGSSNKLEEITKGLFITIFVLLIIIPLLASSNPIFKNLVSIDISILSGENFIRILFFLFLLYIVPRFMTISNREEQ